jgi:hypothetical protein
MTLTPCPRCSRHVRAGDPACPFCGAAIGFSSRKQPARFRRFTRAAAWAFGASLSLVGCNSEPIPGPTDLASPPDAAQPLDLAQPLVDLAIPVEDLSGDAGEDISWQPLYGAPPPPDAK